MHRSTVGPGQGTKRTPYLKRNSPHSSTSSGNFASFLFQGPLRRIIKRRNSLLSLFPRSNTAPADYSSSALRCFAKLQVPPSPLSARPSLQTQLVELQCPSIQHHRSRELFYHSQQPHPIYIHSASCSSTDIEDDGQGGYGGDPIFPHEQVLRITIIPSSTDEAVKSATSTMALKSSSTSALPIPDSSKSKSLTATTSSVTRMSFANGSNEAAAASRTSLGDLSAYSSSYPGESSNYVIGSNGVLTPRSSILRNPSNKKTFVDAWRPKDGSGTAVLQIQARQTVRDREAEKEVERLAREKEIERELKEMEQAEKVWGIPKKAFYMGLGEINFNAQMAILGGWGNGSGPATDFRPNIPSLGPRRLPNGKVKTVQTKREREREKEKRQAIERAEERRKEKEKVKDEEEDSEDSIDAEELAALNAIINTRRSMEAASALASRNNRIVAVKRSTSQDDLQANARPSLNKHRHPSVESVQTAIRTSSERAIAVGSRSSSRPRPRMTRTSSDLHQRQSRIRFAPLPQAYNVNPLPSPSQGVISLPETPIEGMPQDSTFVPKESPGEVPVVEGSDTSDMDEPEECDDDRGRRLSGLGKSNSRWYLMGMPKSVFRPQTYRSMRRPTSVTVGDGDLGTSPGTDRSALERRGRRSSRLRRSASLAGSIKSRSSSVGSNDDDERMRRRQLIRASRPGGTGMVTLPDGTRIRARRVGEEESEEEEFNEWGFAGLSRRRSVEDPEALSGQVKSGDKRASDEERVADDMDESSGMAWVKRRRREREESKQREAKAEDASQIENVDSEAEKVEVPTPVKKTSDGSDQVKPMQTPSFNALQAAEVRRRHEKEVASLGAEVLESIAKHKRGKQNPSRSATWDAGQPAPVADTKASIATQTNSTSIAEQRQKLRGRPRRAISMFTEEGEEQSNRPSTHASLRSTDTSRSSSQQPISQLEMTSPSKVNVSLDGIKTPTGIETPTRGLSQVSSQSSSPLKHLPFESRDQSPKSVSKIITVDTSTMTDSKQLESRALSPDLIAPSSQESKSSPIRSNSQHKSDLSPSSSYIASTPLRRYSGTSLGSAPLQNLPRKPDGKGYAVVPLPIDQMGRRPDRPREGRVWQFDDDDDSDDEVTRQSDESEEDSDGEGGTKEKEEEEEDDEENTMNDEELAEEERRTAIQKKRATTRAAGAEMVSSLAKPNTSKGPRSPKIKSKRDENLSHNTSSSSNAARNTSSSSNAARNTSSSSNAARNTSSGSNAARKPIAIPVHKNQKKLGAEVGEGSDVSDDADLWPPTLSGTQLSRTLSAGDSALSGDVNADRRGSGASSHHMRESITLAAHSAKARIVRDRKSKEKKEKEKLRALKRKEEQDLDYGWPKSLHGSSLYN